MAEQWQVRRGTKVQNDTFIGAEGEITMDTTNKTIRIHDGTTTGGTTITTNNDIQTLLNSIYNVGSIYIGTQSVCPMIALIPDSTWESVGTSLVTNVNSTAAVDSDGTRITLVTGEGEKNFYADHSGGGDVRVTPNVGADSAVTSIKHLQATVTSSSLVINIWKRTA